MTTNPPTHIPVLIEPVTALLNPRPGETYLDCTAGLGGHASAIAAHLGPSGRVVLMDLDAGNLAAAAARVRALPSPPRVDTIHASFAAAPRALARLAETTRTPWRADLVLADLGFASPQVDDPDRGLSFAHDGPLDMRLHAGPDGGATAADLVASLPRDELCRIIREFGEERHAAAVADRIVEARARGPITRTGQLAQVVRSVVRRSPDGIDPATRTFQALRIAVNDELGNLEALMGHVRETVGAEAGEGLSASWLAPRARVGIISFHSLEDRVVKRAFAEIVAGGYGRDLSDGVVRPTPDEAAANPRSRSARLRVLGLGGSNRE